MKKKMVLSLTWYTEEMVPERNHLKLKGTLAIFWWVGSTTKVMIAGEVNVNYF
jgi:hypothetical protein